MLELRVKCYRDGELRFQGLHSKYEAMVEARRQMLSEREFLLGHYDGVSWRLMDGEALVTSGQWQRDPDEPV